MDRLIFLYYFDKIIDVNNNHKYMVGGEFADRLVIKKNNHQHGGEIKISNSSGFLNPKLEELFWRGEGSAVYKKENEEGVVSASDMWLRVRAQDIRGWLIEEIGLQEDGKDVDLVGLKETFINRLEKVIKYYEKKKKTDVVENLTRLIKEL